MSVIASASDCAAFAASGLAAHVLSRRLCGRVWCGLYEADASKVTRPTLIRDAAPVTANLDACSRTFCEHSCWRFFCFKLWFVWYCYGGRRAAGAIFAVMLNGGGSTLSGHGCSRIGCDRKTDCKCCRPVVSLGIILQNLWMLLLHVFTKGKSIFIGYV